MNRAKIIASAAGLAFALATPAFAQHNEPVKAGVVQDSQVLKYDACTVPNTYASLAGTPFPACNPPTPTTLTDLTNIISFGAKGNLTLIVKAGKGDVAVVAKGSDILRNASAANGAQLIFASASDIQVTSDSCNPDPNANGTDPCTWTPIPSALFILPVTCTSGKCALKTTINTQIPGTLSSGSNAGIELPGLVALDNDGDVATISGIVVK
jgi:hypothetical protein